MTFLFRIAWQSAAGKFHQPLYVPPQGAFLLASVDGAVSSGHG